MAVEGIIYEITGPDLPPGGINVVGLVGTELECEGCEAMCGRLYETEDMVLLCAECVKACRDD